MLYSFFSYICSVKKTHRDDNNHFNSNSRCNLFLERLRVSPGMVNYFDVYSCHKYKPTERIRLVQKKTASIEVAFCMYEYHPQDII